MLRNLRKYVFKMFSCGLIQLKEDMVTVYLSLCGVVSEHHRPGAETTCIHFLQLQGLGNTRSKR